MTISLLGITYKATFFHYVTLSESEGSLALLGMTNNLSVTLRLAEGTFACRSVWQKALGITIREGYVAKPERRGRLTLITGVFLC